MASEESTLTRLHELGKRVGDHWIRFSACNCKGMSQEDVCKAAASFGAGCEQNWLSSFSTTDDFWRLFPWVRYADEIDQTIVAETADLNDEAKDRRQLALLKGFFVGMSETLNAIRPKD